MQEGKEQDCEESKGRAVILIWDILHQGLKENCHLVVNDT